MRFLAQEEIPDQQWLWERTPAGVTLLRILSGFSISEEKSFMYTLHLILHCGKLDKSEVFVSPLHSSEMEVVKISC